MKKIMYSVKKKKKDGDERRGDGEESEMDGW